jgi:hypothetical protein
MALRMLTLVQVACAYCGLVTNALPATPPDAAKRTAPIDVKEMIGSEVTFRINGVERYSDDVIIDIGVPFTVKGAKGIGRWELQETATPLSDDTFALDVRVKCGGVLMSQQHVTAQQGQHISIKSDGKGCTTKPEAFEAVVMLVREEGMTGTKPGTINVDHYQIWCKVYVTEQGVPKTVEVLSVDPHTAADAAIGEAVKKTVLTWEFTPNTKDGKPVAGYVTLPVEVN